MLKLTGVRLEKIADIYVYLFIEKGLRGGISYITKRYTKANNKHMKNYDLKNPSKFIIYLDMNNVYHWPMSSYLLYDKFKWLKNVDKFDVNSISEKSPIGYILKVDLEYPEELHVLHKDYPLTAEKLAVFYDIKKIAGEYEIKVGDVIKSIPNLGSKTNYVVYYKNI